MKEINGHKPGYKHTALRWIPEEWEIHEFENIAFRSDEKFDPTKNGDNRNCIELEHIAQETGEIFGYVDPKQQASLKNVFYKGDVLSEKLRPYL